MEKKQTDIDREMFERGRYGQIKIDRYDLFFKGNTLHF